MKISGLFFTAFIPICAGSVALAATPPEVFTLAASLDVAKCMYQSNSANCEGSQDFGNTIEIPLSNCTQGADWTSCTGTWETTQTRDTILFNASISVTKSSNKSGEVSYSLSAVVGPQLNSKPPATVQMNLTHGPTMTDSLVLTGPEFMVLTSDGRTTYTPNLYIGAPLPIP